VKKETESGEDEIKPKLRRKPTELDSDDDEDTVDDVKPLTQEVKVGVQPPPVAPEVSFTDLVRNQKGDLLFVQLPDVLPGQAVKREDGANGCNMASLGEGLLGKLQIRRSGACQLLLGEDQVVQNRIPTFQHMALDSGDGCCHGNQGWFSPRRGQPEFGRGRQQELPQRPRPRPAQDGRHTQLG